MAEGTEFPGSRTSAVVGDLGQPRPRQRLAQQNRRISEDGGLRNIDGGILIDGEERDWDNAQAALEWAEAYLHRADGMYFADEEVSGEHTPSRGTVARGESGIKYKSPLNVLKDTYNYSFY